MFAALSKETEKEYTIQWLKKNAKWLLIVSFDYSLDVVMNDVRRFLICSKLLNFCLLLFHLGN